MAGLITVSLFLLILVPLMAALGAYQAKDHAGRVRVIVAGAALTMVLGIVAAVGVLLAPGKRVTVELGDWASVVAFLFEIAIIAIIVVLAVRIRNLLIFILGVLQLGLAVTEELWPHVAHVPRAAVEYGPRFLADPLAAVLLLIVSIIGSVIVLYAIGYMKHHESHAPATAGSNGRFFLYLVGFLGLMNGLVLADDLRWLSVFWEATTLCSFMLIGHDGTPEAQRNAARALLINSFGGAAMVTASLVVVAHGEAASLTGVMTAKMLAPMALLCVAAFTKSAQMPFQSWLLGAMVAPTPVSALLHSATMVKAGCYLVLRLAPAFGGEKVMSIVAVAGAFTFALASALAVSQSNSKKVLAYSTIANLGLIIACAGMNSPLAFAAALTVLCFHALSKSLLFLSVGTIEQTIGSRDIEDMGIVMYRMPLTTFFAMVGMVSMLMPPFGMLLSKWMAIESAVSSPLILVLLVAGSALTVVFWAKWLGRIQTVSYHPIHEYEKMPFSMLASKLALAVAVMVAGLMALPIVRYAFGPLARHMYHDAVPASSPTWRLLVSAEGFPLWPILLFLMIPLGIWMVTRRCVRESDVRLPYLCGENIPDVIPPFSFRTVKDQPAMAWMATMYMRSVFQEARITTWGNLLAWLIILTMFGVIRAI